MNDFFLHKRDDEVINLQVLTDHILELPANGTWKVRFDAYDKRSNQANRYLHGVMLPLVRDGLRDAGWNHIKTIYDAKVFIKKLFLTTKVYNEKTGEEIEIIKGTSELSKEEFTDFKESVQQWAAEYLNIYVPDPNEQLKIV